MRWCDLTCMYYLSLPLSLDKRWDNPAGNLSPTSRGENRPADAGIPADGRDPSQPLKLCGVLPFAERKSNVKLFKWLLLAVLKQQIITFYNFCIMYHFFFIFLSFSSIFSHFLSLFYHFLSLFYHFLMFHFGWPTTVCTRQLRCASLKLSG